jgi:biopolymer transport protein ExbB/TolQ
MNPYVMPQEVTNTDLNIEALSKRRQFWFRAIWISVAGIIIPPLFGLIATIVGMIGAFGELSSTGEADPEELAGDISMSLLTTMWGFVISFVAFLVLIYVLIRFFKLPKMPLTTA